MSNNNNKFPMTPEHFSDYGFDPHFNYFQALDSTPNQQSQDFTGSINSLRLKLHKPTTPLYNNHTNKHKNRRWWNCNKIFNFFKCKSNQHTHTVHNNDEVEIEHSDVHFARAREFRSADLGTLYMTQTPPHYGNQLGLMSPVTSASGCNSPYLSLRELNMERQHLRRMNMSGSVTASPIYLVT